MNTVTFPGFGLEFHLNRIAFSLGSFQVYWYGVILAFGFLLGTFFCVSQAKRFGIRGDDFLDVIFVAAPLGIVGARIYYILFNPSLFLRADGSLDIMACLNIHNGGIAIYGAIIAGALGAYLVCRHKKISMPALADLCAYGLLLGQIAGRWGNFVNAEAYGSETTLPWRMGIETAVGQVSEVHPTFLYESLWNLIGFCLLLWMLKKGLRSFDGMIFLSYVAWYGFGRGFIEGLRTDSLYFFSTGIRTSQLLGFASCVVAIGLLIWKLRSHPKEEALYVNQIEKGQTEKGES